MEAVFKAAVEIEPTRIVARGVVRENGLESLRGRTGLGHQFRPQRAVRAEDALLHAQVAHLLQDVRRLGLVRPQHDPVHARVSDDPQCARKVRVAGHELLLDHDRVTQSDGCVPELRRGHSPISVVQSQQCDTLQTKIGIDMARQRISLHAVVLQISEVPRNISLGNGWIGRGAIDDRNLGFKSNAQHNMSRLRTDRAEDRPVLIVVNHFDRFVPCRAPDPLVGWAGRAIDRLGLPVVVVVMHHQLEWLAAVAAARVGFFHGQLRPVQHVLAIRFVRTGIERTEESDPHFVDVLGIGDVAAGANVNIGL